MPRGLPDYYNPDTLVSQRLANVEEIVTILQGIANLDNRGRTFYYTHFAEGIPGWYKAKTGDGVLPVAAINHAEIAPACLQIDSGTDGGNGTSTAIKSFLIQDIKLAGLEFSYLHHPLAPELTVHWIYDNGTLKLYGQIVFDHDAGIISIMDGATPRTIFTLPGTAQPYKWITIKLVVDFETPAYVRILEGFDQVDISAYSVPTVPTQVDGTLEVRFVTDALDDNANIAYIGHLAITIDEP